MGDLKKDKDVKECFDDFHYDLIQFKRMCKKKFGLNLRYQVLLTDDDGELVEGVRSKESPESKQG